MATSAYAAAGFRPVQDAGFAAGLGQTSQSLMGPATFPVDDAEKRTSTRRRRVRLPRVLHLQPHRRLRQRSTCRLIHSRSQKCRSHWNRLWRRVLAKTYECPPAAWLLQCRTWSTTSRYLRCYQGGLHKRMNENQCFIPLQLVIWADGGIP